MRGVLYASKLQPIWSKSQGPSSVDLGKVGQGYGIAVTLNVSIPGMERDAAHQVCPYSNATRGNIDVTLNVV